MSTGPASLNLEVASLEERGLEFRLVEKDPARVRVHEHTIIGNAADLACLETAWHPSRTGREVTLANVPPTPA